MSRGLGSITPDDLGDARSGVHDKGRTDMASSGKKKTTMAKLMRESRLRERRLDKQARKDARRHALTHPDEPGDTLEEMTGEPVGLVAGSPAVEAVSEGLADDGPEVANLGHDDDHLRADDRTRRALHGAA
jgi:hypothetical protein